MNEKISPLYKKKKKVQRIRDMNWIESEVNAITICLNKNNTNEIITEYFGNKKRRRRKNNTRPSPNRTSIVTFTRTIKRIYFEMKLLVEHLYTEHSTTRALICITLVSTSATWALSTQHLSKRSRSELLLSITS